MLTCFHTATNFVPFHTNGLMISRKSLAAKPKLKSQIGRRYNDSDFKLTNIEFVPSAKARPAFLSEHQLALLDALKVAIYTTKFCRTG